jgi:hypothetical protein
VGRAVTRRGDGLKDGFQGDISGSLDRGQQCFSFCIGVSVMKVVGGRTLEEKRVLAVTMETVASLLRVNKVCYAS